MRESYIDINRSRLLHNLQTFQNLTHPHVRILANLKANAYGLGAVKIGQALESQGVDYFSVAFINEGIRLRKAGIHTNLLVFNPSTEHFLPLLDYRLEPEVSSIFYLKKLIYFLDKKGIQGFPIHLKLDTGMHRAGITKAEIPHLMGLLKSQKAVHLKSVFSHLAAAEDPAEDAFTLNQIANFEHMSQILANQLNSNFFRHLLNTAGAFRFPQAQYDMIRPGLGLFGYNLVNEKKSILQPIAQVKSKITQVKTLAPGESVGYNRSFTTKQDSRIGLIPLGYADGLDRRVRHVGHTIKCRGYKLPIVGSISMDTLSIDLSGTPCREGDEVIIFDYDDVAYLANKLQTIPYEIIAKLPERLPKKIR